MTRVTVTDELKQRALARRRADFDTKACAHFRKLHGRKVGWHGEEALTAAARQGVKDAQRWGANSLGGILDHLTLVYMMGHRFPCDPQYQSWVGPWVQHMDDSGERLKTEHLILEALQVIPTFNPTEAAWLGALDGAEARLQPAPAHAARMSEADARKALVDLLECVWPRRMQVLSEEELTAEMLALNPILGTLGCKTPDLFATGTLLALRYGIGFLDDPRYPPFAEIAAHQGLAGHERLGLLINAARELELHPERRILK